MTRSSTVGTPNGLRSVRLGDEHPANGRRMIGSLPQRGADPFPVFPKERRKRVDSPAVNARSPSVGTHPLPGALKVFRVKDPLHQGWLLNPLMLPSIAALGGRGPGGPFVHPVRDGVRGFLFGSVLHGVKTSGLFVSTDPFPVPGLSLTTMTSADSSPCSPGIIPRREGCATPPR